MRVTYSRRLIAKFRAEAKRLYPREAFAVLLGTHGDTSVTITDLYLPEGQESNLPDSVPNANQWHAQARRVARDLGWDVVGEIHSHPESAKWSHDPAPSTSDWDRAPHCGWVHGICSIRRSDAGRFTTRTRFWPSRLKMREVVTD